MSKEMIAEAPLGWTSDLIGKDSLSRAYQKPNIRRAVQDIQISFQKSQFFESLERIHIATENDLMGLWRLEKNWDSYGADVPNQSAIGAARNFLRTTANGNPNYTRILPSAEGGVAVVFVHDDRRAIAEFLNDGTRGLMLYDKAGSISPIEPNGDSSGTYLQAIRAFLFGGRDQ